MTPSADKFETLYARDRQEWRDWLEKNQATSPGIRLILFKKESGKACVVYTEAVEEALCFGWIDSITKKVDDARWSGKD